MFHLPIYAQVLVSTSEVVNFVSKDVLIQFSLQFHSKMGRYSNNGLKFYRTELNWNEMRARERRHTRQREHAQL